MSKKFVSMYITDVSRAGSSLTFKYSNYNDLPDVHGMLEGINLFSRTARTNVCFKGADGKFVSYRDLDIELVKRAVENLIPFPEA